jgi:hypothetical protein
MAEKATVEDLKINRAVVIDDALGAPAQGTVAPEDKDTWADLIAEDAEGQSALRDLVYGGKGPDLDKMLEELTGQPAKLDMLWHEHCAGAANKMCLDVLFKTAILHRDTKLEKAQVVVDKLSAMLGPANVQTFPSIEAASTALESADVAFVDFYLSNSELEGAAIERITNSAQLLQRPKLLFFMSSRALLEVQKSVRQRVGVRSAFFDVMRKGDIEPEFLAAKLEAKRASYAGNKSLESLIDDLVSSTKEALQEFVHECDELELHDLRMLDLARLDAEGESLGEYLTWLFSESVAAKARRLALPATSGKAIPQEAIGFTGQLSQGKVLSDQFSEIVFGPAVHAGKTVRFGELIRKKGTEQYLLVLTPACDLQRCEPTKPVLCVEGVGETFIGSKAFAREKLYGKQDDGRLCHLFTRVEGEKPASTLISWQQAQAVMHTVRELGGAEFERVALMNELFAQEVKEDVLRALGRVGTQIDPPPSMAYQAKVRWKWNSKDYRENDAPKDEFVSAVLTYSEQKDGEDRKKTPTLVLSDEFRLWIRARVEADPPPGEPPQGGIPKKVRNALDAVLSAKQLTLGPQFTHKLNELTLRVHEAGEATPETSAFLQIDFWPA